MGSTDARNSLIVLGCMMFMLGSICIVLPRVVSPLISEKIIATYQPPTFTDDFIVSAGVAGPSVHRSMYPHAHSLIKNSGCITIGQYFGSHQMNCVLEHYGIKKRVLPGDHVYPALNILERR